MENQERSAVGAEHIDREAFCKVWARVMPDQSESPIAVGPPETLTPGAGLQPVPRCSCETVPPVGGCLKEEQTLCLGPGSSADAQRIAEQMDMAKYGALYGQLLSRKSSGNCARAMANLAADHRMAVKRLSAAYFLITGRRYRPRTPVLELPASVPLALRELFLWEQKWEQCSLQAGEKTGDPCLKSLYEELGQEGALHAGTIRSLLEQMA